ncbi:MAG: Oligopeptide ABC transporter, periplasmic oligopeptide-binding protein OppA [uncultured Thermomicrobiales bacterium]|uniref:Oligopeptide ABC transporter, periplasmic oligopeptide-binding protein OppA n=1 Tax=uncultured Thermomicrobiales bacterium TaxID=1645740 RepID=A0A6J4UU94_9BACT|nr:MAG: Oligopeptide ABC transporter, periplasmic oligopeptide-binding protein OppA [uncultured Thermomicrobiales bacterium]
MAAQLNEQLRLLEQRFKSVGLDRRGFMKVAAGAAAGTMMVDGVARYVGPAAAAQDEAGPDETFYNFALRNDPVSFDWNLNLYVNADVETFSGLLMFDADLNAIPDWAETFESNEDASVWTFNIRRDNQGWSNGTEQRPVTAGDFVYSFRRQLDPRNGAAYAGFLFDIKNAERFNNSTPNDDGTYTDAEGNPVSAEDLGIVAVDDWTLEVTMEGPRGYFPQVVAYLAAYPAPQWAVEEYGSDRWALAGDVPLWSNGPFLLDSWEHDVLVTLKPNPGHWDAENITLKRVYDPIIPAESAILAYEQGEGTQQLDWVNIDAANLTRYQEDPELSQQLREYVYPGIWMLVPSNGIPPFDQLEVRKAVSHAIDRTRVANITNGLAIEAFCMVPIGVFGFLDDPELQEIQKFDPELAMEALVGTEFEGGQNWPEITMHMRAQEEVFNADIMANDIVAQLQENLGMSVQIQTWPEASWRPELFKNEWQMVWIRWWSDYPDPNNSYGDMFYSRKASGKRQAWSNAQFDDLVNQGKSEADPEARLEIYRQAEQIIQEDVGYMPIVYRVDQYAFKPWVKDLPENRQGFTVPEGNIYVRMLSDISVEGREE